MALNSPFTKTSYIDFPPLQLWSGLSELSVMLPPRAAVLILPQIKLNSQVSSYTFFFLIPQSQRVGHDSATTTCIRCSGLPNIKVSGHALGGRGPILPRVICVHTRLRVGMCNGCTRVHVCRHTCTHTLSAPVRELVKPARMPLFF